MTGSLPDDTGREWPVVQHRQSPTGPQKITPPNLVLHTTETDSYVPVLRFPSNFQCGDGVIGQHIQLGMSGDAVLVHDNENIGIEMVGRSKLDLWLPAEQTLGPTVALVAWLHATNRIKTGIRRPSVWPNVLDRGPEAVKGYYRRTEKLWPNTPGVYGHVDIPDNDHWDPGSFDYPTFFARVETVLAGGNHMSADMIQGSQDQRNGKPLKPGHSADYIFGYHLEERIAAAAKSPAPTPPGAVEPHTHGFGGTTLKNG